MRPVWQRAHTALREWYAKTQRPLPPAAHSGKLAALDDLLRQCGIVEEQKEEELERAQADQGEGEGEEDKADDESTDVTVAAAPHRALLFAQHRATLDLLEGWLARTHPSLRYARMDGQLSPAQRAEVVAAFQQDTSISLLLLTTRVGGLGINLTGTYTRTHQSFMLLCSLSLSLSLSCLSLISSCQVLTPSSSLTTTGTPHATHRPPTAHTASVRHEWCTCSDCCWLGPWRRRSWGACIAAVCVLE